MQKQIFKWNEIIVVKETLLCYFIRLGSQNIVGRVRVRVAAWRSTMAFPEAHSTIFGVCVSICMSFGVCSMLTPVNKFNGMWIANGIWRAGGATISLCRTTCGSWKYDIKIQHIVCVCVCSFVCLTGAKIHYFIIFRILHICSCSEPKTPNAIENVCGLFSFIWKLVERERERGSRASSAWCVCGTIEFLRYNLLRHSPNITKYSK